MIKFEVKHQILRLATRTPIVADSQNYVYAYFDFLTDEWKENVIVIAQFKRKDVFLQLLLDEESKVLVPWECLKGSGYFTVTIFALGETSEEKLITTNLVDVPVLDSGIASEQNPAEPTVGLFQDSVRVVVEESNLVKENLQQAISCANSSAESAIASANSAIASANSASVSANKAQESTDSAIRALNSENEAKQYSLQAMWASNIVVVDGKLCVKVYDNEVTNNG